MVGLDARNWAIIGVGPTAAASFIDPFGAQRPYGLAGAPSRSAMLCTDASSCTSLAVDLRAAREPPRGDAGSRPRGEVADQAAGLGDQQRAAGDVPGRQAGLEEAVVPAGSE